MKQIALIDTITFVGSTLLLLFHSIPLEKSEQVPTAWFDTVYYLLLGATALIGGLLVTIVLMLYHTVSDMIKTLGPGADALLVAQEEEQEA